MYVWHKKSLETSALDGADRGSPKDADSHEGSGSGPHSRSSRTSGTSSRNSGTSSSPTSSKSPRRRRARSPTPESESGILSFGEEEEIAAAAAALKLEMRAERKARKARQLQDSLDDAALPLLASTSANPNPLHPSQEPSSPATIHQAPLAAIPARQAPTAPIVLDEFTPGDNLEIAFSTFLAMNVDYMDAILLSRPDFVYPAVHTMAEIPRGAELHYLLLPAWEESFALWTEFQPPPPAVIGEARVQSASQLACFIEENPQHLWCPIVHSRESGPVITLETIRAIFPNLAASAADCESVLRGCFTFGTHWTRVWTSFRRASNARNGITGPACNLSLPEITIQAPSYAATARLSGGNWLARARGRTTAAPPDPAPRQVPRQAPRQAPPQAPPQFAAPPPQAPPQFAAPPPQAPPQFAVPQPDAWVDIDLHIGADPNPISLPASPVAPELKAGPPQFGLQELTTLCPSNPLVISELAVRHQLSSQTCAQELQLPALQAIPATPVAPNAGSLDPRESIPDTPDTFARVPPAGPLLAPPASAPSVPVGASDPKRSRHSDYEGPDLPVPANRHAGTLSQACQRRSRA